jgi:DNA modification methylase
MGLFLDDGDVCLYQGDVRDVLAGMPDGSVDCVVTSPPYWGLRDYGTGAWQGGEEGCNHAQPAIPHTGLAAAAESSDGKPRTTSGTRAAKADRPYTQMCGKCGATRVDQQLGLEATPDEFVANMVAVFREVRRVLAPHGTCWVNLGDSYGSPNSGSPVPRVDGGTPYRIDGLQIKHPTKPKDLVGIPWRVAFALQADGWYLRSDIIWAKPNPMPESVTDRPTKSHEYVFLLTKQPRYYFDQEAVRESYEGDPEYRYGREGAYQNRAINGIGDGTTPTSLRGPDGRMKTTVQGGDGSIQHRDGERWPNAGRNVRSVWQIATQPYPEAHFATYPEELVRRCVLAGCREGGTVLDPFVGSGTTCKVARDHGRHSIGIDLSAEYLELAARRLQQLSLLT